MPTRATIAQRLAWHVAHQKFCACRAIPSGLAKMARAGERTSFRSLLTGGDRRSIARSQRALALILASPGHVADVAALAEDADWLVSLRAMDVLEKLVHDHPDWVEPYRGVFIGPLANSDKWELRLQIVRALPFLRWTRGERKRVLEILRRDLDHPQTFVRAWALDSLARFAKCDPRLMPLVRRHLSSFARSGRPALVARARRIRRHLSTGVGKGDITPSPRPKRNAPGASPAKPWPT